MQSLLLGFIPTLMLYMKIYCMYTHKTLSFCPNSRTAYCYRKLLTKKQQQPNHFLVNLVLRLSSSFCFQGSENKAWIPFIPRVSSLCCWMWGRGDGEMKDFERQSCSLMACKVISFGLVELKAASLGCNSWQTCPPFTPANPSFRAFPHIRVSWKEAERGGYMRHGRKWQRKKEICNQAADEEKFKWQPKCNQN